MYLFQLRIGFCSYVSRFTCRTRLSLLLICLWVADLTELFWVSRMMQNRSTWLVLYDTTFRYLILVEDVVFSDGICQKFESLSTVIETVATRCQDDQSGNPDSRSTNRGSDERREERNTDTDISIGRTCYWYSDLSATLLYSLSEWLFQQTDETQTRQFAITESIVSITDGEVLETYRVQTRNVECVRIERYLCWLTPKYEVECLVCVLGRRVWSRHRIEFVQQGV